MGVAAYILIGARIFAAPGNLPPPGGTLPSGSPPAGTLAGGIGSAGTPAIVTDPNYILAPGDAVAVSVVGEPDLAATQLIDRIGSVRLRLVGEVRLVRLSVREAETLIASAYRDQEYLRAPEVHLQVVEYAPRFVTLLGAIRTPGKFPFSRDLQQMEIVDVITQSGGFLPIAKGESVIVTRSQGNDTEKTFTLDVASMMSGKRRDDKVRQFLIYPGDRIFVPERLF